MPAGKNSWHGHASPLVSNDPIPASQDHHLDPLLKVAFQECILHSGGGKKAGASTMSASKSGCWVNCVNKNSRHDFFRVFSITKINYRLCFNTRVSNRGKRG